MENSFNIYQVNVNLHNGDHYNVMHYSSAKKAVQYAWNAYIKKDADLLGKHEQLKDIQGLKNGCVIITIVGHARIKSYVLTKRKVF